MHYSKPFTKLFSSIITSSIWNENDQVRVVWITMLALSDANGFVCASLGGLAHAARVSKLDCEAALGYLLSPDDDSRSREFGGQRIEGIDGGYLILNYKKYRDLGRKIDRDEYLADKQWESRQKRKQSSTPVNKESTIASASASVLKKELEEAVKLLTNEQTRKKFNEWMTVRRGMGKKPKNWDKMFTEQAQWLAKYAYLIQIEILSASIRNNWQGLFEPKTNGQKPTFKPTFKPKYLPPPSDISDEELAQKREEVRKLSEQWKKEHGR